MTSDPTNEVLRCSMEKGEGQRDREAVDAIMGHEDGSMAAEYTERISDERLLAVTNEVRHWLFAEVAEAGKLELQAVD